MKFDDEADILEKRQLIGSYEYFIFTDKFLLFSTSKFLEPYAYFRIITFTRN